MTAGLTKQQSAALEHDLRRANDNWPRLIRLYRYLRDNEPTHRDKIMHWCGFPSPKDQPVIAYVEFATAVMRLDRILCRHGMGVEGGLDTGEVYRLAEARAPMGEGR